MNDIKVNASLENLFDADNDFYSQNFANETTTAEKIDCSFDASADYTVILLNDNYTTKEFVVEVLLRIFHKTESEAICIMENVHQKGMGVVGVYAYDIAATRVDLVTQNARANGFPLRCVMKKA